MSLFDKIKALFGRASLPEETRLLLTNVKDVEELRAGLDQIATQNEVEAREIERDIEKLGRMEAAHKERVLAGGLAEREKMTALREIRRLRRRMDSLEKRHRIHQDNIDLHLGLFDRITEMQAMELKRVNQGQIEEIAVDYEEKLEKHRDIMNAAKVAHGMDSMVEDSAERRALADLEREILAEARADAVETEPVEVPDEDEVDRELEAIEREVMAARAAARAPQTRPKVAEPAPEKPAGPERPRRRSIEEELAELDAQEPEDDEDEGREAAVE